MSFLSYKTSVSLILNVKVIGSNPEISISYGIIKFINGFHKSQVNWLKIQLSTCSIKDRPEVMSDNPIVLWENLLYEPISKLMFYWNYKWNYVIPWYRWCSCKLINGILYVVNKVQYTNKQKKSEEKKSRKPIKVNYEEYKNKSAIERFLSWIESYKKVFPICEIKETFQEWIAFNYQYHLIYGIKLFCTGNGFKLKRNLLKVDTSLFQF